MFKTIYGKIIVGIIVLAIGFGAGYYLMPKKTETITKTVTETKYVTVTDKKAVDALNVQITSLNAQIIALNAEKVALQQAADKLGSSNDVEAIRLKALRTRDVDGYVDRIEVDKDWITDHPIDAINDSIKVLQDQIVDKNDAIADLIKDRTSRVTVLNALIADDPVVNATQITALYAEIQVIDTKVENKQDAISDLNTQISNLEKTKDPWTKLLSLDDRCLSEITRYINTGEYFSSTVITQLKALGIL